MISSLKFQLEVAVRSCTIGVEQLERFSAEVLQFGVSHFEVSQLEECHS